MHHLDFCKGSFQINAPIGWLPVFAELCLGLLSYFLHSIVPNNCCDPAATYLGVYALYTGS